MINAYSGDVSAEQIKSDNATTSGVKFQFKSSAGKNLASENPLGKNVSRLGVKRFHSLLLTPCNTKSQFFNCTSLYFKLVK
jgi:hypothetical protein